MGNVSLSLRHAGSSPLATRLGQYVDAGLYARFDNQFGSGGIYYAENSIKSFTDVVASPPAGEPTSSGLLIDGSDAPTLVQGSGPVPWLGYSGTDHTVAVTWDANGVTGDRVILEARKDANDRITLHFVSGILRLEAFVGSVSQGFVAVPGVDDGGIHSAVLYWDEVGGTLMLQVDDIPVTGPELWTGLDVPIIDNYNGSAGAYDQSTQTMSVPDASGNLGYPRYGFNILVTGLLYQVTGRLSGQLENIGIRLALSGSTAYIGYDAANGIFDGMQEAEGSQLQIHTPGSLGPWSTQIAEMSAKQTSTRTGVILPDDILTVDIGHRQGANQINGRVIEFAAATGDFREVW